jgi:hypothetical protein
MRVMRVKRYIGMDITLPDSPMIADIEDSLFDERTCSYGSPYHLSIFCIHPNFGFPENATMDCSFCVMKEDDVNGLG